jgi:hypothetical protein
MKTTVKEVFIFGDHGAKLQPKNGMDLKGHNTAEYVRWTYTRKEWSEFLHASGWKKRWPHIMKKIMARFHKRPAVLISTERLSIGGVHYGFSSSKNRLRNIDLREEGSVHVLSFEYENLHEAAELWKEVKVPVPRGKLREAIGIQNRIMPQATNLP